MIGVDVGGTKMNAALVHEDGRIEDALTRKTKVGSQEEFLAELDDVDREGARMGAGLPLWASGCRPRSISGQVGSFPPPTSPARISTSALG